MKIRLLSFVLLGPNGPELQKKRPAGVGVHRLWDAWWFRTDNEPGKHWPAVKAMKSIGEDFIPRQADNPGVMGVIEQGNAEHLRNFERFRQGYQEAHAKPVR